MASTSGPVHRLLVRTETSSLDAAGVHLVLDGRLSSTEGREGLKAALRQASQQSGELRSRVEAALDGSRQDSDAGAQPTCLSSRSHHLPQDILHAFQAGAVAREAVVDGAASADAAIMVQQGASGSTLAQQDSLVHPPIPVSRTRAHAGNGSSNGGVASSSPPQRPPISTAIERTSTATLDANGGVDHGIGMHDPSCTCPPYAVKSTCGKRQAMEDTYALCPNICELPMSPMAHEYADKLPHRIAVQFETHCMYLPSPEGQQHQPQQQGAFADGLAAASAMQQHHASAHRQSSPPGVAGMPHNLVDAQQSAAAASAASKEDTAAIFAGAANLLPAPLSTGPDAENSVSSFSSSEGGSVEKLHFFGVYDGHGGIEASQHCAQRLHYHLSKAMADMASLWLESSVGDEAAGSWNPEVRYVPLDTARVGEASSPGDCSLGATTPDEAAAAAAARDGATTSSSTGASSSSTTADRELGRSISQTSTGNSAGQDCEVDSNEGSSADGSEGTATSFCGMMESVLREAFLKTDEEFSTSGLQAGLVGSTAVVALVGTHRVWIANCGDSRAVLSRAGVAVQVTDDHKPEREDEAERVEKAGGQVLYWNGHRVMGVLAMSRAIGDHCLRPYVIPEPEITVFARHPRDEILLLASDGLWDVLSNQDATDLALRSIKRAREKGASRKAAARVAATVLTKAAVDRGSRDNITVVIIDLSPTVGCERAVAEKSAAANGPSSPDSMAQRRPPACEAIGPQGGVPPGSCSSSGQRPSSSGSSKSRPGSSKGSGTTCNPFAAAAVSPFSTAATCSSELPLPSGATGSGTCAAGSVTGAAASEALAAAGVAALDRSNRNSAGSGPGNSGRLRTSGTGSATGSTFAAAAAYASSTNTSGVSGVSSYSGGGAVLHSSLSQELESIDLSGAAAVGATLPSIESMAAASSAAEGSTNSSSLEEQPTIVEPPPAIARQPSSSPFSAFQGGPAFDASDD